MRVIRPAGVGFPGVGYPGVEVELGLVVEESWGGVVVFLIEEVASESGVTEDVLEAKVEYPGVYAGVGNVIFAASLPRALQYRCIISYTQFMLHFI